MKKDILQCASQVKSLYTQRELEQFLVPLAEQIISLHKPKSTVIVGIQGGQGTGKTTLSTFLQHLLSHLGYAVQHFSIDDFYETYAYRKTLAKKLKNNPFYDISRGMPGTHRVKYLWSVLQRAKAGKRFSIPVFDKSLHHAQGDVSTKTIPVTGRQDFILFEGWCLGMPTVSSETLMTICKKNKIPLKNIDHSLQYHKKVLFFLKPYQLIWKKIDYFVMLKPDSLELHKQWRLQQERELQQKTGRGMSKKEVHSFVDVFLPFTYVCYEKVKADIVLYINKKHNLYRKQEL